MALRPLRGFTLVELLSAVALFAVLGTLLLQLMQGALDVWARGERVREGAERADAALDLLASELRHTWTGPGSRFLLGWRDVDADADGRRDHRSSLLRFARLPGGEQGGRGAPIESLWFVDTPEGESLPALLHRVRRPVGGAGSLLAPELGEQSDRLLHDAREVLSGVLRFEVACGPLGRQAPVWDSTRGLLLDDPAFPHDRGAPSLEIEEDDVFPSLVQLSLVLAGEGTAASVLGEPLGAEAEVLVLGAPGRLVRDGVPEHVWVDGEWMGVTSVDGRRIRVERGPLARSHEEGAPVRSGRRFERWVEIPTAREVTRP